PPVTSATRPSRSRLIDRPPAPERPAATARPPSAAPTTRRVWAIGTTQRPSRLPPPNGRRPVPTRRPDGRAETALRPQPVAHRASRTPSRYGARGRATPVAAAGSRSGPPDSDRPA